MEKSVIIRVEEMLCLWGTCNKCTGIHDGRGYHKVITSDIFELEPRECDECCGEGFKEKECPNCNGSGSISEPCVECKGTKFVSDEESEIKFIKREVKLE